MQVKQANRQLTWRAFSRVLALFVVAEEGPLFAYEVSMGFDWDPCVRRGNILGGVGSIGINVLPS